MMQSSRICERIQPTCENAWHRLGWTPPTRRWQPASGTRWHGSAWGEAVAQQDPEPLVVVDTTGTHPSLTRREGWAPHDQRAAGSVPRNYGTNTTLVAGLTAEGLQAPWTIEGAMDTVAFERSVQEVLGPTLRPGQVVVLDNLSVHKATSIRAAPRRAAASHAASARTPCRCGSGAVCAGVMGAAPPRALSGVVRSRGSSTPARAARKRRRWRTGWTRSSSPRASVSRGRRHAHTLPWLRQGDLLRAPPSPLRAPQPTQER